MFTTLLLLTIPLGIILTMVIMTIHRTNFSDIKIGKTKQLPTIAKIVTIGSLIVIITICLAFLCFLMIPPIPEIKIGYIDKNMSEGILCSKGRTNCLFNLYYRLFYKVGVYVEHPDKPGMLSRVKKHVTNLDWWNGKWKIQGTNIKGSDTIHVFLIKREAVRNNKYHANLKKEKGYFMFENKQIPYGKDKKAEIVDCDNRILE
ncbi:MAG: hypothetical protein ABH870_08185 [bacterium]